MIPRLTIIFPYDISWQFSFSENPHADEVFSGTRSRYYTLTYFTFITLPEEQYSETSTIRHVLKNIQKISIWWGKTVNLGHSIMLKQSLQWRDYVILTIDWKARKIMTTHCSYFVLTIDVSLKCTYCNRYQYDKNINPWSVEKAAETFQTGDTFCLIRGHYWKWLTRYR